MLVKVSSYKCHNKQENANCEKKIRVFVEVSRAEAEFDVLDILEGFQER
jgi:hypothetical protein